MNNAVVSENSLGRQSVTHLQDAMVAGIASGELTPAEIVLNHFFVPDKLSGYSLYAREVKMPKGAVVVGKIHKQATLNILSGGKLSLIKDGVKIYLEAPCTYVSDPGTQKAAYIEEDATWINVHITKHNSESKLDLIEEEVIDNTFGELDDKGDSKWLG